MSARLSGAGRHDLVDRIVAAYDEVAAGGAPRWISLEAPSGWGKTRIVQEVYARLATTRQDETGRYWPPTLTDGSAGRGDILRDRKTVAPAEVEREAGSVPAYFWWGIGAFERSGIPSVALSQDLRQFDGHLPYLVARCKQLSRLRERGLANARELATIAVEEARDELTSAVLDLAGLGIPGVGLVWRLGSWTAGRIAGARRERSLIAEGSVIRDDRSRIAADALETIRSVSRPGLPLVAVVEDLQYADDTLVGLLVDLIASGRPVLILTTAWPGTFDASPVLSGLAGTGSIVRLSSVGAAPSGWPPLTSLTAEERASIIREYYPRATAGAIAALTDRVDNPLQLRLLCTLPSLARQADDGFLDVDAAAVAALPPSLDGAYEQMWMQLPDDVRESLALALCGIPSDVDPHAGGGDDRWDAALLSRVALSLFPRASGLVDAIDTAQTGYAWAELVDDALRVFPDEANRRVVEERRPEFYSMVDISRIRRELTRIIGEELDYPDLPDAIRQHRAALLLALSAEGFEVDAGALTAAADVRTELLDVLDETERVIEIVDQVAEQTTAARVVLPGRVAPLKPELRLRRAVALMRSERWDEARSEMDEIRAHAELLGGIDDPLAIDARIERAVLEVRRPHRPSDPDLGLAELERAVERVFGAGDDRLRRLLRLRYEIDDPTDVASTPEIATADGRRRLGALVTDVGVTDPDVLAIHRLAARAARDDGYPGAAAAFLGETAATLADAVGERHPEVARLRLDQARCLLDQDHVDDAVALAPPAFETLRAGRPAQDPSIVEGLVILAAIAARTHADPGIDRMIDAAIADDGLSSASRMRLVIARELLLLTREDEPGNETLGRLLDLIVEAGGVCGERDDAVTDLRVATGRALLDAGHIDAARTVIEPAVWICAPWATRPATWRADLLLGRCLELLDRAAEAATAYAYVAAHADDARGVAERSGTVNAEADACATIAEDALARVQAESASGWYPTEAIDIRPRGARAVPPWADEQFAASDDDMLRLAQHRFGRTLIYGSAERGVWELSQALVRFHLNRGEEEEAFDLAAELMSIEVVPEYARSRGWTRIDAAERSMVLGWAQQAADARNRPDDTLPLIERALSLAETVDERRELLDDLGRALLRAGRAPDAYATLRELISISPPGAARRDARARMFALLEEAEQIDDLLSALGTALAEADDAAERAGLRERQLVVLESNDRHEALVSAVRDAWADTTDADDRIRLRVILAKALDQLGRRSEALSEADAGLEEAFGAGRIPLLRLRAHLRGAAGDDSGAADDLYEVLAAQPEDRDAVVALVDPLVRLHRIDEATEHFARAVESAQTAGLDVEDFSYRLSVLSMVVAHGDPGSAVTSAEEYLLLLDGADLGSVASVLRTLGERELARARALGS